MSRVNKLDVVGILQEHGAFLEGHFLLPTGMHSPNFVQTALVLQYPNVAQKIAAVLSARFPQKADVVVSPAMGAIVLGQEVARVRKCRFVFFERMGGVMGLYRHFRLNPGERVLVIEDLLTSGRSTGDVVALSTSCGAKVVGLGALVDRSRGEFPFRVPVRALVTVPTQTMRPNECDLCKRRVPLELPENCSAIRREGHR